MLPRSLGRRGGAAAILGAVVAAGLVLWLLTPGKPALRGVEVALPPPLPAPAKAKVAAALPPTKAPPQAEVVEALPPAAAVATVPLPKAAAVMAADPALIEGSADGPLPMIGPDGRQPWQAYARPFDGANGRPRIAVVILGLGLDAAVTHHAIVDMPGAVTLAFDPYADKLGDALAAAHAAGHEVLLQLPMEPLDYPRQDPGPKALLTGLPPAQNLARLRWVMSRGTGYVGLSPLMGGRFDGDAESLLPILAAIKQRGLLYIDNRAGGESAVGTLAPRLGLVWAVADRSLDAEPVAATIDQALADLEVAARRDGAALAIGQPYPVTLDHVAAWAATLAGKGLVLAPVSAVVDRQPATRHAP